MKIKPLAEEVLVEIMPETKSEGGIEFLPDHEPTGPCLSQRGIIREVGAWKRTKQGFAMVPEFKRGDRVIFPFRAGRKLESNRLMKLLPMDQILAVETPSP